MTEYTLIEFCRWVLIYCLGAGAIAKLYGFKEFSQNLADGFGVADKVNGVVAAGVIVFEGLLATSLLFIPDNTTQVFAVCLLLFAFFAIVLIWALRQERNISCHCFGHDDGAITALDVWRNAVLMATCLPGMLFSDALSDTEQFNIPLTPEYLVAFFAFPCFLLIVHFKDTVNILRYRGAY